MAKPQKFENFVPRLEHFFQQVSDVGVEQYEDGHIVLHTDRKVDVRPAAEPGETSIEKYPDGHVAILTDRRVEVQAPHRAHVVEYKNDIQRDALKERFGKAVLQELPEHHRLMISMTNAEVDALRGEKFHIQKVQWHGISA